MKKTFLRAMALSLALILVLPFSSCSSSKVHTDTYYGYFDSFATLTVHGASKEDYNVYHEVFTAQIDKYHRLLDAYNEYADTVNLCTLNHYAADGPVTVSADLLTFLEHAVSLHDTTRGYTSISLGALTSLWKKAINEKTVPSLEELEDAALHTDISSIEIDLLLSTVYFKDSELKLDAGAFAKGYAAKQLYDALVEAGCESFLVNVGGTVCGFGKKNDNKGWYSGIQSPTDNADMGISINVSGKAISTSGSYYRSFESDGVVYHHIIDPFTLYPKNTFASVSVVYSSAFIADALSTALFSMTLDEGMAMAEDLNFRAVWILPDGTVHTTNGIDNGSDG